MYQEAAMALRLVDDDRDVSLDLPLDEATREAVGIQLQRCVVDGDWRSFKDRLVERIVALVDDDLHPPSMKQLIYAIDIAKSLQITVPNEALRFRGAMFDFLQRFAPLYREKCRKVEVERRNRLCTPEADD